MKWETIDTGLGWKRHISGDYTVEPDDLDTGTWQAFFGSLLIGFGTWRECRKICADHKAAQ